MELGVRANTREWTNLTQKARGSLPERSEDGYSDHLNSKFEARNTKWFGKPFGRFTVLSKVEGLTTLSPVERQILMIKIPMTKTNNRYAPCY